MKEKSAIDDSLSGKEPYYDPPGTYYGFTLTSQLGGLKPCRNSIRSLHCSRLEMPCANRNTATIAGSVRESLVNTSRPTSAQSRGTITKSRATSARSTAISTRSDFTSEPSRFTSSKSCVSSVPKSSTTVASSTLCTSALYRPMSSAVMTSSAISGGRKSLFSRKSSQNRVSSRGLTTLRTNGSYTDIGVFHIGLSAWLLEKGSLVPVKDADIGFFHQGDCYIVLQNDGSNTTYLHLWQGSLSSQHEKEKARVHLQNIDKAIEGASFLSVEQENHETSTFLSHFESGIVVIEGKHRQPINRTSKYVKRLYTVEGLKYPKTICIDCVTSAVRDDRVLLLDGYPRMYLWMGRRTDCVLRVKAIHLAKKMRTWQRNGKGHIVVIDATDEHLTEAFLRKLHDDKAVLRGEEENENTNITVQGRHLYRLSGDRVLYDMPLVAKQPLQQKYLTSSDCYLLDSGPSLPVQAWVGNDSDSDALFNALYRAETFAQHKNYPNTAGVCRLLEGEEPNEFKTAFSGWRDRAVKERQLARSYSVANVGRALYSGTDRRTVAKLTEVWSDDLFLSGQGTNQLWRVDSETLIPLAPEDLGVFFNRSCYIILHRTETTPDGKGGSRILYYWVGGKCSEEEELQAHKSACSIDATLGYTCSVGGKCSEEEELQAHKSACSIDATLGHTCSVLRVLDSKEPRHFFVVLQGSMIVYDSDQHCPQEDATPTKPLLRSTCVNMFCVREMGQECMRVEQVPPLTSYLNSSAAYLLVSETLMVWYGKNARGNDREYAKNMLTYFCPEKPREYSIINEGKENNAFWLSVEDNGDYPREFCKQKLHRRVPALTKCKVSFGKWSFQDIPNFSQEDLSETSLYVLDSHDQIQIWCGSCVFDKEFMVLSKLLKAYLDQDPCERCREDVSIWTINQNHEPSIFTRHFRTWDPDGYGGQLAYDAARKRLRQENALIDIDCQMIDTSYVEAVKVPYRNLVKEEDLPADIDLHHKENHLSDADFTRVMRQSRAQLYRLPLWKQTQILSSAKLIYNYKCHKLNKRNLTTLADLS
ncbi:villin-1 [Plakobranchus ocellatus]|uniref:Villin-1 n=1 Tax=Plakobranchus ocellatus TaxID=259542 RepID=A0AAV4D1C1_9GAST|nr:villin-1 [Plakobranchus ocellatus]